MKRTVDRLQDLELTESVLARASKLPRAGREAFVERIRERLGLGAAQAAAEEWNVHRLTKEELRELCRLCVKASGYTTHAQGERVHLTPEALAEYDAPEPDAGVTYSRATPYREFRHPDTGALHGAYIADSKERPS